MCVHANESVAQSFLCLSVCLSGVLMYRKIYGSGQTLSVNGICLVDIPKIKLCFLTSP